MNLKSLLILCLFPIIPSLCYANIYQCSIYDDPCLAKQISNTLNIEALNANTPITPDILYVSIKHQTLFHIKNNQLFNQFSISSSKFGSNCDERFPGTPWGLHIITEKIGENQPINSAFVNYTPIGKTYKECLPDEFCCITSRILRIKGLNPGINAKQCAHNNDFSCQTYDRYIGIHGTDEEHLIGSPVSFGCIRMYNSDVIELFNSLPINSLIFIEKS